MIRCENCKTRKGYAKVYDVHFDWRDCPYTCEYADEMVNIQERKQKMSTTMSWGRINPVYDDIFERLEKIEWNNKKPTLHSCLLNQYFVPDIKKVIFNKPATIIIWNDNTKTVVKCTENDVWDAEKGFVMAYLKKIIGVAKLRKGIKKWVKPQEEAEEDFSKNIADHLNSEEKFSKNIAEEFTKSLGSLLVDIFNGKNSEV